MFQGINAIEFNTRFKDNDSCYQYLLLKKWENGYLDLKGCTDPKAKNYKPYYLKSDTSQCRY